MAMRRWANLFLLGAFLLFCSMLYVNYVTGGAPWSQFFLFVAEASLVGGIADWFAVTALFRKPLGFISFHTELIPRNRNALIQGVANMVEEHLLSADQLRKQLEKARFATMLVEWVEQKGGGSFLAEQLQSLLVNMLRKQSSAKTAAQLESFVKRKASELDVAGLLQKVMRWAIDGKHLDAMLDRLFVYLREYVEKPTMRADIEALIGQKIGGGLLGGIKSMFINKEDLARQLHAELIELSGELLRHEHVLRVLIRERFSGVAADLEKRSDWQQAISLWFADLLERVNVRDDLAGWIDALVEQLEGGQAGGGDVETASLRRWLNDTIDTFWQRFRANDSLLALFDGHLKTAMLKLVTSEHQVIGEMVKETLDKFDNEALVKFVEDKVGDDLQGIRINGSVVGAVVGALLYALLYWVYAPLVM
jgi:uncharacterized membrane-anchored protein YjiN (DUF445 family)